MKGNYETQSYAEEIVYIGCNNLSTLKFSEEFLEDILNSYKNIFNPSNYDVSVSLLSNFTIEQKKIHDQFARFVRAELIEIIDNIHGLGKISIMLWDDFARYDVFFKGDKIDLDLMAKKFEKFSNLEARDISISLSYVDTKFQKLSLVFNEKNVVANAKKILKNNLALKGV